MSISEEDQQKIISCFEALKLMPKADTPEDSQQWMMDVTRHTHHGDDEVGAVGGITHSSWRFPGLGTIVTGSLSDRCTSNSAIRSIHISFIGIDQTIGGQWVAQVTINRLYPPKHGCAWVNWDRPGMPLVNWAGIPQTGGSPTRVSYIQYKISYVHKGACNLYNVAKDSEV